MLAAIKALVQYQTNANDIVNHLKLIKIDKERREFLQEVSITIRRKSPAAWRSFGRQSFEMNCRTSPSSSPYSGGSRWR